MKRCATLACMAALLAACGDDSSSRHPPDAPHSNAPPGIYVINYNSATITVFPVNGEGDVAPMRTISGAATGLGGSIGINVDSDGYIYVANRMMSTVTVYPKDATGNVAPTRTLTGMSAPETLAITADDDVLVASCAGCNGGPGSDNAIFHVPKGATTFDTQIAGANTMFSAPGSIGLDPDDNTLWVANSFSSLVGSFPAGASGDVAPSRSFDAMLGNLQSATFADKTLFIASPDAALINMYSTTGTGTPTPVTIANHTNGVEVAYPGGIWVETSSGHPVIYVADPNSNAIQIIDTTGTAPNLTVASVKTISGASTGLAYPLGIRVIP